MMRPHVLYCDGASRGNPGRASFGFVLLDPSGTPIRQVGKDVRATNNDAEYAGLVAGLEAAVDAGVRNLEVRLDSQLLVRQLLGEYRVKAPNLRQPHRRAVGLLTRFDQARVVHVPREQNTIADSLANAALDEKA
jgi:ribonuclease HI/probable phosphoglycerate mutase